jgi:subtilisin family serine protease
LVTLEHWVHVAANGDGRACPATEPEVADREKAFPDTEADEGLGKDVKVVVIDTGYVDQPGVAGDPNRELREYDGHGSFIEGVIKSRAPGVEVHHLAYPVHPATHHSGGVVSEYELARLLGDALDMDPDIINISAGCHRINNQPFEEFKKQWLKHPEAQKKVAVIAAAGNDRSPDPFFPAANEFAIGVGSLDQTGDMSYFSNYNQSADVFVLGRKHVNRFPNGRYTCRWQPHRGQPRLFTTGWAEWSGTSFAAPLFAGLVASKMTREGSMARQAADDLVNIVAQPGLAGAPYGPYPVIDLAGPEY